MVPWGTGDPINSGDLNTQVFLTGKPPPLSVSVGGGSMSRSSSAFAFCLFIGLVPQVDVFKPAQ